MVTKEQAMTEREFHQEHQPDGSGKIYKYRRNGRTRVWVTRPDEFRVPVVYGLRGYDAITELNAALFHPAAACPNLNDASD